MQPLEIKPGPNRAKGRWYVDLKWPDGARSRHLLPALLEDDPVPAIAAFERDRLPGIIADRQIAEAAEAQTPQKRPAGRPQGPLLRELASWYLDTHLRYVDAKPKTLGYYASTLHNFLGYCQARHIARAGQISSRIIQEWQMDQVRTKGRERPSREQVLHVRRWLNVCLDAGELHDLPNIQWNVPKKRKGQQHRAHPREVIDAWLEGLNAWRPHVGLVARWVAATGWRIGDALDLRVKECDLQQHWIDRDQIKTAEHLPYPLTPHLLDLLNEALRGRKQPKAHAHVFLNHKRQPWTYPQIYRVLENYHNGNHWKDDPITFRDLRKSFGSQLALDGCPPNVLKELMGHSDIAMTLSYYVQVDRSAMRKWAEHHTQSGNPWQPPPKPQ